MKIQLPRLDREGGFRDPLWDGEWRTKGRRAVVESSRSKGPDQGLRTVVRDPSHREKESKGRRRNQPHSLETLVNSES